MVRWEGVLYEGGYETPDSPEGLRPGELIAGGNSYNCEDESEAPIELWTIDGVDPDVALLGAVEEGSLPAVRRYYLAPGYLPWLPSHPLHDAIYGGPAAPDERDERDCGDTGAVEGAVSRTPGPTGALEVDGLMVVLDARTRVAGFPAGDPPKLVEGDRVRIEYTLCALRLQSDRPFPVADRIMLLDG